MNFRLPSRTALAAPLRRARPATLVVCILLGLSLGAVVRADAPNARRPGEAIRQVLAVSAEEQGRVSQRADRLATALGIPGRAGAQRRSSQALDLAVVDEVEMVDRDGRTTAVIRTDPSTGAVRSVARLDWTRDADQALVSSRTAESRARRLADLAGLPLPNTAPAVRWDDGLRAWRVTWPREIDGVPARGDGSTIWVHPGGQLAAMARSESAAADPPTRLILPAEATDAARAWARRSGIVTSALRLVGSPRLSWVRPNDWVTLGGADDTSPLLRLAFEVHLVLPADGGQDRHVLLFVDAGSGVIIAGAETA